jgi:hypothetical protein
MTDIDSLLERFSKQHSVLLDALPEAERHGIYYTLRCQDALDADLAALSADVLSSDAALIGQRMQGDVLQADWPLGGTTPLAVRRQSLDAGRYTQVEWLKITSTTSPPTRLKMTRMKRRDSRVCTTYCARL